MSKYLSVAELIRNTDIGYKAIPARSGGTAKILVVPKTGRTTIILSLSRYSNTALVVALITIYPVATNECPKVSIDYLRGAKDAGNYTPKIYYVAEADGSISLYVRTAQNEDCGYRVISNFQGDTTVSMAGSLPDEAIQI